MARDGDLFSVQILAELGVVEQGRGELAGQVCLHLVAAAPRLAGRVEVEPGRDAKVPAVGLAGVVEAARGGVGVEDSQAELRGAVLEEALFRAVLGGAGQAGEVDQEGDFGGRGGEGFWREVEVQGHGGCGGCGVVGQLEELAAEGGDGCFDGEGRCHFDNSMAAMVVRLVLC